MIEAILAFGLQFGQRNLNLLIIVEFTKSSLILNPDNQNHAL